MTFQIRQWSSSPGSNGFASAEGGWPEGMQRTTVNNAARENLAAIRTWYQDPEWLDLHDGPVAHLVVTREAANQVRVAGTTDLTPYPTGCRVRTSIMYASGAEAHVTGTAVAGADILITLDQSNVPVGCDRIERYIGKTLRDAAFRQTGIAAGQVPLASQLGTAAFKNEGPGSTLDADLLDGQSRAYYEGLAGDRLDNALLNGGFRVWQRGTPIDSTGQFNNDDGDYVADGWKLLAEVANAATLQRETVTLPTGFGSGCRLTAVGTTNKYGILQILESRDCRHLMNVPVILSVYAATSAASGISTLKLALLAWTAAEDAPTADPISVWNADGVDPSLVANWSFLATASLSLTTSFQRFSLTVTPALGAMTNLAVFIWHNDKSYNANDLILLAGCDLKLGSILYPFREVSFGEELARAQRYFAKSFNYDVKPAQNAGLSGAIFGGNVPWRFPLHMLKVPTIVRYNPSAANTNWSGGSASADGNAGTGGVALSGGGSGEYLHATAEAVL